MDNVDVAEKQRRVEAASQAKQFFLNQTSTPPAVPDLPTPAPLGPIEVPVPSALDEAIQRATVPEEVTPENKQPLYSAVESPWLNAAVGLGVSIPDMVSKGGQSLVSMYEGTKPGGYTDPGNLVTKWNENIFTRGAYQRHPEWENKVHPPVNLTVRGLEKQFAEGSLPEDFPRKNELLTNHDVEVYRSLMAKDQLTDEEQDILSQPQYQQLNSFIPQYDEMNQMFDQWNTSVYDTFGYLYDPSEIQRVMSEHEQIFNDKGAIEAWKHSVTEDPEVLLTAGIPSLFRTILITAKTNSVKIPAITMFVSEKYYEFQKAHREKHGTDPTVEDSLGNMLYALASVGSEVLLDKALVTSAKDTVNLMRKAVTTASTTTSKGIGKKAVTAGGNFTVGLGAETASEAGTEAIDQMATDDEINLGKVSAAGTTGLGAPGQQTAIMGGVITKNTAQYGIQKAFTTDVKQAGKQGDALTDNSIDIIENNKQFADLTATAEIAELDAIINESDDADAIAAAKEQKIAKNTENASKKTTIRSLLESQREALTKKLGREPSVPELASVVIQNLREKAENRKNTLIANAGSKSKAKDAIANDGKLLILNKQIELLTRHKSLIAKQTTLTYELATKDYEGILADLYRDLHKAKLDGSTEAQIKAITDNIVQYETLMNQAAEFTQTLTPKQKQEVITQLDKNKKVNQAKEVKRKQRIKTIGDSSIKKQESLDLGEGETTDSVQKAADTVNKLVSVAGAPVRAGKVIYHALRPSQIRENFNNWRKGSKTPIQDVTTKTVDKVSGIAEQIHQKAAHAKHVAENKYVVFDPSSDIQNYYNTVKDYASRLINSPVIVSEEDDDLVANILEANAAEAASEVSKGTKGASDEYLAAIGALIIERDRQSSEGNLEASDKIQEFLEGQQETITQAEDQQTSSTIINKAKARARKKTATKKAKTVVAQSATTAGKAFRQAVDTLTTTPQLTIEELTSAQYLDDIIDQLSNVTVTSDLQDIQNALDFSRNALQPLSQALNTTPTQLSPDVFKKLQNIDSLQSSLETALSEDVGADVQRPSSLGSQEVKQFREAEEAAQQAYDKSVQQDTEGVLEEPETKSEGKFTPDKTSKRLAQHTGKLGKAAVETPITDKDSLDHVADLGSRITRAIEGYQNKLDAFKAAKKRASSRKDGKRTFVNATRTEDAEGNPTITYEVSDTEAETSGKKKSWWILPNKKSLEQADRSIKYIENQIALAKANRDRVAVHYRQGRDKLEQAKLRGSIRKKAIEEKKKASGTKGTLKQEQAQQQQQQQSEPTPDLAKIIQEAIASALKPLIEENKQLKAQVEKLQKQQEESTEIPTIDSTKEETIPSEELSLDQLKERAEELYELISIGELTEEESSELDTIENLIDELEAETADESGNIPANLDELLAEALAEDFAAETDGSLGAEQNPTPSESEQVEGVISTYDNFVNTFRAKLRRDGGLLKNTLKPDLLEMANRLGLCK